MSAPSRRYKKQFSFKAEIKRLTNFQIPNYTDPATVVVPGTNSTDWHRQTALTGIAVAIIRPTLMTRCPVLEVRIKVGDVGVIVLTTYSGISTGRHTLPCRTLAGKGS